MKKLAFLLLVILFRFSTQGQTISIADSNFKAALIAEGVDTSNDGEIQISEALAVTELDVSSRDITNLEGISNFINLTSLNCNHNNLTTLNLSNLKNLKNLYCIVNQLNSISLSGLTKLTVIECQHNKLTALNLSELTELEILKCSQNNLSTLEVSNLTKLKELECGYNEVTNLNLFNLPSLNVFNCAGNLITTLDVSSLTSLKELFCMGNNLTSLNTNGLINLEQLNYNFTGLRNLNISHLKSLETLQCKSNNINNLNLPNLTNLKNLYCDDNQMKSLDITNLNNLIRLDCSENQLTKIDFSNSNRLQYILANNNSLESLDISNLSNLVFLNIENNLMTNIDLPTNSSLTQIKGENNLLTSLDLSSQKELFYLFLDKNNLTSVDLSNSYRLNHLGLIDNKLETLFIKNDDSNNSYTLDIRGNNDLKFICTDESEIQDVQNLVDYLGYTNCVVNSYCTFIPGGDVSYITGNVKLDIENDGCDDSDIDFNTIKLKFTNSDNISDTYSINTDGSYDITLPMDTYTIEAQLENPHYFTISPESFTLNLFSNSHYYEQDICLSSKGSFNDVEISILPIGEARPGFDANYKIVYKNIGTTSLSGSINLAYNDNVLDFISSNTSLSSQNIGELNWKYTDLEPTEKREILYTMNLNSPIETPPLNSGDVLTYNAVINPTENEEVVINNTFTLNQEVVNSYDPNDKTCLQGNFATPDIIGEYVHYLIRFENLGTASAINVVVKDVIDTEKFDVSTLEIYDYSHSLKTRIRNTNEVEFIFEGINLPFEDALNDGYVAFKIKTLNSLVIGDTFENKAEIYFDYNAPIITNNEQTIIDTFASLNEFSQSSGIEIFPNPASNLLNIESKTQFDSLVIYDLTGRELNRYYLKEPLLKNIISTKNLASGIYYISIESGKSKKLLQFIRK